MDIDRAYYFQNGDEWRKWLEQNHDRERGIWLIYYKKHSGKKSVSYSEALDEALCFGWIDSRMRSIDDEKFVIRYTPRKANSIWSKINKDNAQRLIESGKMTSAGLAKIEEAKRSGSWDNAYTSKKKEEMPADLERALMEDEKAWINFNNLATSYRNDYIYWINSARTERTRNRRITEVVKRSILNKKPGAK